MTDTPNPGSDEAIERGCHCPIPNNAKGRGKGEDAVFWVTPSCPLHGVTDKQKSAMDELTRIGQELGEYD